MTTDVELERINNWLRVNIHRVLRAADEGSLTAQNALRTHRFLVEAPKDPTVRETMLRQMDAFDRAYERRIAQEDRRQDPNPAIYKRSWVALAVFSLLALAIVIWMVFR